MWNRADDPLTRVLESMDAQTFDDVARKKADLIPAALRSKTVAAMRRFIETSTDHAARLRTALDLVEFGETGLDGTIKHAMAALPGGDMRNLGSQYIQPALEHLRNTDPAWASEWVATQLAEEVLHDYAYWLPFATAIPDDLVEKYLQRLETENLKNARFEGMIAVIAARADAVTARRVFAGVRELRRQMDAAPGERHEFEWQVMGRLEDVFRRLPDEVATAGVISSITGGDPLDIKVAADLLSRVARSEVEPLRLADDDLKARLRAYLKGSVDLVLRQDDFDGAEKANLASSIAQVGEPCVASSRSAPSSTILQQESPRCVTRYISGRSGDTNCASLSPLSARAARMPPSMFCTNSPPMRRRSSNARKTLSTRSPRSIRRAHANCSWVLSIRTSAESR